MKRVVLLGLLVLSLFAVNSATPVSASPGVSVMDSISTGYYCPPYTRYCSRNSQCAEYCGAGTPPAWEICSQGCCACLG